MMVIGTDFDALAINVRYQRDCVAKFAYWQTSNV